MIQIKNLSKTYKIYARRSDRLREWLSPSRKPYHQQYRALKQINLNIGKGKVFGIIGMNGAGKSTLLKILTGTCYPTSGEVQIEGRIAALLELGTGFHPELTGEQNVKINGKLLGLSAAAIEKNLASIQSFSELGDYFYEPIRTYSSGMYLRLAFSLAISVDPEVLIIDEALSVGDAYFQQKCVSKLNEFKKRGVTILFVSHDPSVVTALCDEVALLDKGELIETGSPQQCLEHYNALLAKKDGHGKEYSFERNDQRIISGNKKAEIKAVDIFNIHNDPVVAIPAGAEVNFVIAVKFNDALQNPTVGILIKDRLGYDIFGANTAQLMKNTGDFKKGEEARFSFSCDLNLGPGAYTITAAIHSSTTHIEECYQWVDRIKTFNVLPRPDYNFTGVAMLEPRVEIFH